MNTMHKGSGYKDNGELLKWENHWGHYVFSDTPITGVIGVRSLEWIDDETNYHAVCNLSYDNYMEYGLAEKIAEWQQDQDDPNATPDEKLLEQWRDELGEYYAESGDTYLIGDYIYHEPTKQWDIDYDGDNHFAAIVDYDWGGGVVHVVWSRYVVRAALGSPCIPGQCNSDTPGDYLAYDLPLELYGEFRQNINPQYIYASASDFLDNQRYA